MNKNIVFMIIALGILLLGGFLRFYHLTDRPFHHDESLHAYYSYQLATTGEYRYDPMMHGPFLFFTNAGIYRIFGDSNFTSRLLPALFGIFLIFLGFKLEPFIGTAGALWTGFLIAISPTLVYYSRFIRNDIYIATFCLGMLLALLHYNQSKKNRYLYIASALLALAFCSKENTYFVAFSFFSFGILYFLLNKIKFFGESTQTTNTPEEKRNKLYAYGTAFFIFWIIYLPFYTVLFHHPEDWNGFKTGLVYWFKQHQIQRIGAPWWYYLPLISLYEFLPAILGLTAILTILRTRNKNPLLLFLIYWFITSFILYSYAGEKVPWLLVHIAFPLILLSGWLLGKWTEQKKWIALSLTLPLIVLTLNATCLANFRYPALDLNKDKNYDHAELIAYVQSTYDIPQLMSQIQQSLKNSSSPDKRILITGEATWPLTWYTRKYTNTYFGQINALEDLGITAIISDASNFEVDFQILGTNYDYHVYHLRAWWPQPSLDKQIGLIQATKYLFHEASPSQLASYFLTRKTFWTGGSSDIILWTRKP